MNIRRFSRFNKITAFLTAAAITLSLNACSSSPSDTPDVSESGISKTSDISESGDGLEEAESERDGESVSPIEPREEIPYEPYVPADHDIRDISSWDLVSEIKTGWSLGNTFDAFGDGVKAESAWGNPKTTYTMIYAVAEAGFDAARIPVTWGPHVGGAPDYLIEAEWLDRLEEVIGYVLSTDMYCILNTHHEGWIVPDEEHLEENSEQLSAMWKQISERFAGYNEKLIFEGMNEPRTRGSDKEWNGGTPEEREVINKLNKVFIDTVRATGGRNGLRHLMIPTYAASAEVDAIETLSAGFSSIAGDDNKIIVSIHAYTPNDFALKYKGTSKWDINNKKHTQEIEWILGRIKDNFIDKGIPVIMGETGARDRGGNHDTRAAWAEYYFGKCAELGMPVFWWDNGMFTGSDDDEIFGLLDREAARFRYPNIIEAIMTIDGDAPSSSTSQGSPDALMTFYKGESQTEGNRVLTSAEVKKATVIYESNAKEYSVSLELNESGTRAFADATAEQSANGGVISIWLDDVLISAPRVIQPITGGTAVITGGSGGFTADEARDLADIINGYNQ